MRIHTLVKSKGLGTKARRKGRGNATKGNYSGRGLKGQKARSGGNVRPYFEGGQTSIVQRIPKARGFKRYFKLISSCAVINVSDLESDADIKKKATITRALLEDLGYVNNEDAVKILGNGEITKTLTFDGAFLFSRSAQEKIVAAGGSVPQTEQLENSQKDSD